MSDKVTTGPQGKGAGSGRCCVSKRGKQHRGFKGQSDLNSDRNKTGNQAGNQVRNREHGRCRKNGAGI